MGLLRVWVVGVLVAFASPPTHAAVVQLKQDTAFDDAMRLATTAQAPSLSLEAMGKALQFADSYVDSHPEEAKQMAACLEALHTTNGTSPCMTTLIAQGIHYATDFLSSLNTTALALPPTTSAPPSLPRSPGLRGTRPAAPNVLESIPSLAMVISGLVVTTWTLLSTAVVGRVPLPRPYELEPEKLYRVFGSFKHYLSAVRAQPKAEQGKWIALMCMVGEDIEPGSLEEGHEELSLALKAADNKHSHPDSHLHGVHDALVGEGLVPPETDMDSVSLLELTDLPVTATEERLRECWDSVVEQVTQLRDFRSWRTMVKRSLKCLSALLLLLALASFVFTLGSLSLEQHCDEGFFHHRDFSSYSCTNEGVQVCRAQCRADPSLYGFYMCHARVHSVLQSASPEIEHFVPIVLCPSA